MGEVKGYRSSELLDAVQRTSAALDEAHRQLLEDALGAAAAIDEAHRVLREMVSRCREEDIAYAESGKREAWLGRAYSRTKSG